jgi:two-component system, chemotaxis family, response regulator Rcp1
MPNVRPVEILLVEDSPTDRLITRKALQHARVISNLSMAEDGIAALQFLRREGGFADAPRPDLILLDLNLPRKDGRKVLEELKADPDLKRIPVIILTTSQADKDVLRAYGLHANCYVVKPVDFERFAIVVRSIQEFWFSIVTLPPPNIAPPRGGTGSTTSPVSIVIGKASGSPREFSH